MLVAFSFSAEPLNREKLHHFIHRSGRKRTGCRHRIDFPSIYIHTHHLHKLHNSVEQKTILGKNPLKEVQNTFEKMRFLVQTKFCHVVV